MDIILNSYRKFVLSTNHLNELTENAESDEWVICGSGKMARDLYRKMKLLNLNVHPYLYGVGDCEDEMVKHYSELRNICNGDKLKYIIMSDSEEWYLNSEMMSIARENTRKLYEWLDNQQIKQWAVNSATSAKIDGLDTDMFCHILVTVGGQRNAKFGAFDDESLSIQIFGGSSLSDITSHAQYGIGSALHNKLTDMGIRNCVTNSAQWSKSTPDNILRFISEGAVPYKLLIIPFNSIYDITNSNFKVKNMLPIRYMGNGCAVSAIIEMGALNTVLGEVSQGVSFDEDMIDIAINQFRALNAITKVYGTTLWVCAMPNFNSIPEGFRTNIATRSNGYFRRYRKLVDDFLERASNHITVKDFSDAFNDTENIFSLFMDDGHLTVKGVTFLARRIANEISKEFSLHAKITEELI